MNNRQGTHQKPQHLDMLVSWHEHGMLRPLDLALAQVLLRCLAADSQGGPEVNAEAAVLAAVLSRHLSEGHTCLRLDDLATDLVLLQPISVLPELSAIQPHAWWARRTAQEWHNRLHASALVTTEPARQAAPLVLDTQRLYLYRLWAAETRIAESLRRRLTITFQLNAGLIADLHALFADDDLPDGHVVNWQMLACGMAAAGALTLITGGPGTGKTTTVMRLLALLQQQALATTAAVPGAGSTPSPTPLRMALAAPTGKAAARLTESISHQLTRLPLNACTRPHIPTQVTTLHRLLGSRPDTRHFIHHANNPLALDVLVIDEASMIDLELMDAVLQALPEHARLILLGDKDQLASVEAGAVLGELCQHAESGWYTPETRALLEQVGGQPLSADGNTELRAGEPEHHALAQRTVMLRHSRRFDAASGIGRLAAAINAMDKTAVQTLLSAPPDDLAQVQHASPDASALQTLVRQGYAPFQLLLQNPPNDKEGHFHHSARPALENEHWHAWARQLLDAFDGFRLLCAVRDGPWGVDALNMRAAHWLGVRKQTAIRMGGQAWYPGRPVMLTRNDYSLGLMNGDIGVVIALPDGQDSTRLRVAFPDSEQPGCVRFVLPSRLTAIETVYAMTVHKSQGSEFDHTVLVVPDHHTPVLTRELLYTGITRARTRLTLITPNPEVFRQAIGKQVRRHSGLRERLSTRL